MNFMNALKKVTYFAIILGAINWGLIGLFGFNLVGYLLGNMTTLARIVYTLIGVSAIGHLILSIKNECDCVEYNYQVQFQTY